jgi:hypothetical protein
VDGVEHDRVFEHHIQMGVIGSLFADFVTHTPVDGSGELGQDLLQTGMRKAVLFGVVDCELKFSPTGMSRQNECSFLCAVQVYALHSFAKGNTSPLQTDLQHSCEKSK